MVQEESDDPIPMIWYMVGWGTHDSFNLLMIPQFII